MTLFATQDAAFLLTLVRTFSGHVAELLTIAALDRRVGVRVVPGHSILHLREQIVLTEIIIVVDHGLRHEPYLAISCKWLLLVRVNVPAEVHVSFDGTSWYDQIRVALRVHRRHIVVVVIAPSQQVTTIICTCAVALGRYHLLALLLQLALFIDAEEFVLFHVQFFRACLC